MAGARDGERVGYAGMNTITRGMRKQPFAPVHSGKFSAITQEMERKQGRKATINPLTIINTRKTCKYILVSNKLAYQRFKNQ